MVLTFKYPLVSMVFVLMAGTLKGLLVGAGYKFVGFLDPVILSGAWVALAIMYNYVRTSARPSDIISTPLLIYLALGAFLFTGILYTSAPNYAFTKSLKFMTVVFVMFIGPVVLVRSLHDIKLTMMTLFLLGIIFAIGTLIAPHAARLRVQGLSRAAFLEVGPLRTGGMIAMGLIIAFFYALAPRTFAGIKRLTIVLIPVMVIALLLTAARGPFLGLWVCILVALLVYRKHIPKLWAVLIVAATIITTSLIFVRLPFETTFRFTRLFQDRYEAAKVVSARTDMFRWVLANAKDRPIFGHGTGAYAVDRNGVDIPDWPHNIFLELLYEQGAVGVMLIGLFIWFIIRRWRQAVKLLSLCDSSEAPELLQYTHTAGLLFLFNLLQAMKSFDIVGNRLTFFCAGVLLAVFNCVREEARECYLRAGDIAGELPAPQSSAYHSPTVSY